MSFTRFIYNLIGWKNKSESLETPLGAVNLNKMDSAIKTIGDNLNTAYDELSEGKLDKDTAYTMVSNVSYAESTGIFTITRLDGSSITIDTKLEKIVTNWNYDKDSQKMILTLDDGTTQEVDLSALITQYEFVESDTIAFTIESNGPVTANVKDGSITDSKLQPNYLADITTQASNASVNAQNASNYASNASYDAKLSQSYAVGGSGVRENEDLDNAKYYMEKAKDYTEGVASNVIYDNATSGASATNVQDALDELSEEFVPATADKSKIPEKGLVPAPTNVPVDYVLQANGTWVKPKHALTAKNDTKLFLSGASNHDVSTGLNAVGATEPLTNTKCYIGADNQLYSDGKRVSQCALYKECSPGESVSLAGCKLAIITANMGGSSGSVAGTWIYTSYGGALRELESTGTGKPSLSGTTLTIGATSMSGGATVYGWS